MKSIFAIKTDRNDEGGYIFTHVGFNHKLLEKTFVKKNLKIIRKEYSPFKYLFGFLNSQVFYVLKLND